MLETANIFLIFYYHREHRLEYQPSNKSQHRIFEPKDYHEEQQSLQFLLGN